MWRDSESSQDFLNFTELADQIAILATNQNLLPISIGVFGTWGTGKSTVLKLVESRLPKESEPGIKLPVVVKFDAWMYQGYDDSRAALMEVVSTELLRRAEVADKANPGRNLVKKAKEFVGRVNYFRGLGMIADFGIGMALGIPPGLLTQAGNAVSTLFAGQKPNISEEDYQTLKEDASAAKDSFAGLLRPAEKKTPPEEIEKFRKQFGELLEELDTSLILFIDNLDRCLPDVAIGTLEAIRLFLFMPRTAFVIAADEDMIRHSVAKHFKDPTSSHIRDYLDKIIQVPLRVPQVSEEDLRAYMYSLFVELAAPNKLSEVQTYLMESLQGAWKGSTFDKADIIGIVGESPELLDNLAIADRLAPILASAPSINGNPRIVKRLLNAIFLRRILAKKREMNVDLATLAKLAVFERCTDTIATQALYRLIMEGQGAEQQLLPPTKGEPKDKLIEMPSEWSNHKDFIAKWQLMEPLFTDAVKLRPAVFLSRDVMAPARSRSDLSDFAREALEGLIAVNRVNTPTGKSLAEGIPGPERGKVMSKLIEHMRSNDWSSTGSGIHGAVILAEVHTDTRAELQAFVSSLQTQKMEKGIKYLLREKKYIEGDK